MPVIELDNQDKFSDALKATLIDQQFVFVIFSAKWCPYSALVAPTLDEVSTTYSKIKFLKVDIDKFPEIGEKFNIYGTPTFIIFKCGSDEVIKTTSGSFPERIMELLDYISSISVENCSNDEEIDDDEEDLNNIGSLVIVI